VVHVRGSSELTRLVSNAGLKLVIIDFFAPWCGPCQRIKPQYEALARRYPQALFISIDTEDPANKVDGIAAAFSIRAFPTFTFHVSGQEVHRFSGANPQKLEDIIAQQLVNVEEQQLSEAMKLSTMEASKPNDPAPAPGQDDGTKATSLLEELDAAESQDPEPTSGETLQLKVKRITGDVLQVAINADAKAQHLRRKVARLVEASLPAVRLIFKGKIIKDGFPLTTFGINENDLTIHVAVSKASNGAVTAPASSTSTSSASPGQNSNAPGVARLHEALRVLKSRNTREAARDAVQVMHLYVRNIVAHPDEVKYRSIRQGNSKFTSKVTQCTGWLDCMKSLGFDQQNRDGEMYLVLSSSVQPSTLAAYRSELVSIAESLAPTELPGATPEQRSSSSMPAGNPFGSSGPGDLASMFAAQMGGAGGGIFGSGNGGSMPTGDLAAAFSALQGNPAFMNATSNMMAQVMQNPTLIQEMMQTMATPGQNPTAALMGNPQLMEQVLGMFNNPDMMNGFTSMLGTGGMPAMTGNVNSNTTSASQPANTTGAPSNNTNDQSSGNVNEEEDDLDDLDDIYAD